MLDYYDMKAVDPYDKYEDEDPFDGIPLRSEESINKIKLNTKGGPSTLQTRARQESADSLTKNIKKVERAQKRRRDN
jgi:hypothetical protein